MPASWSEKDERQYKHIVQSCRTGKKKRSAKVCKRIAAATVNKTRAEEGRTLSSFESPRGAVWLAAGIGAGIAAAIIAARREVRA